LLIKRQQGGTKMDIRNLLIIVSGLVAAKRWDDLSQFWKDFTILVTTPTVEIIPGKPKDKE
jgi:hypothetical protein